MQLHLQPGVCCSAQHGAQDVLLLIAEKSQAAERDWIPGGSLKLKEKVTTTPVKLTEA